MGAGRHLVFQNSPNLATIAEADRPLLFDAGTIFVRGFDDFDEMAAAARGWDQEYFKLGGEQAGGSFALSYTARLQLGRCQYYSGVLAQGLVPSRTIGFIAHTGGYDAVYRGRELRRDEIAVLPNGSEFECYAQGPTSIFALALNEGYLRHQAQILADADIFVALPPDRWLNFSDPTYQKLLETLGRVLDLTLQRPDLLVDPIAAKRMEDEIASLLVSCVTSPRESGAPWVRHRAAKRALAFIRANAEELFTISDLCRSIGASQRTLEIGFQELFGVPPKTYLTTLRLNRVRRALRSADSANFSVTEVATRWGFYHFGRFAAAYRKMFGELPSRTLGKGRMINIPDLSEGAPVAIPPWMLPTAASG
ncbi:MAG: helix-turn-helix domain-containing protein [Alphaproteobacteria bacterium]